ncbi:MAG: hypothetical protein H0U87_06635 [Acidobacteria bacterium]|jgi:osmotically-inducible protein OsmY|nr:hypothetical protein [Acidobacteriota bacterium]
MKIKFLAVLGLAAALGSVGCKGAATTNTTTTTTTTTATPMATPMATMTPAMDMATQATVKSALDKAGITGVTVDATTSGVTLRGSVAKGKMAQAVKIAQEAGKKAVRNELTEMAK